MPVLDAEKRVIADAKTIQVTPDLLWVLRRINHVAEFLQTETERPIFDEDELDDATIICEASADLQGIVEDLYKHLDRNYLDAFVKEYQEQEQEHLDSLPDLPDEDEDEI
jgi:hypothetical protein